MLLDISKLDQQPIRLDDDIEVGPFLLEDGHEVRGQAHVEGELRKAHGRVDLTADYDARIELTCARCLTKFGFPLQAGLRFRLVPATDEANLPDEPDGAEAYPLEGQTVDLAEILREQVDLGLPLRAICREDCRGLCSGCGADLNRDRCQCSSEPDDRWSGLAQIRARLSSQDEPQGKQGK